MDALLFHTSIFPFIHTYNPLADWVSFTLSLIHLRPHTLHAHTHALTTQGVMRGRTSRGSAFVTAT